MELESLSYEDVSKDKDGRKILDDNHSTWSNTADKGGVVVRETWGGKFEFLLALIGYSIGLGNIWRFPFLCYRNGGGAFMIPFSLFLVLCGGPMYYIEVSGGQFSGKSAINIWDICPLMRGLGVTMCIVSLLYLWCYGLVFAWILYYLYQSFSSTLPWTSCNNDWNTANCLAGSVNGSSVNITTAVSTNTTGNFTTPGWEFWQYNVLNKSPGIEYTGRIQWHILAGSCLGWLLVFLCLVKGIKSMGKVVYVTVIAPYILLTILLVRVVTLDGSWEGLKLYLIPRFEYLATGQIWMEAAVQVFYSLATAWGSVISLSSFNKFHNNALRDTVIVCIADAFTAFYGGLVVFSVLGFLSKRSGKPVDELPFSGPTLAFIAYPEALGQLPLPQFWSVLFFLTLVFLGIDSQFGAFEVLTNAIIDVNYGKLHKYRLHVSAAIVLCICLLGIPLTFSNGLYIFRLVDWYMATFTILVVAVFESIVFGWIYGGYRFSRDIEAMLGKPPSTFLRIGWAITIPLFLGTVLVMNFNSYSQVEGEGGYKFPSYALAIGNLIAFGPMVPIFLTAVYELYKTPGSIGQRFKRCLRPNKRWQPNDPSYAEVYRTNPYRYSSGAFKRIVNDVFELRRDADI